MTPHTFSLGQRIRELRIRKGLTQMDLAKGICTPSMISQIESDRAYPSYRMISALADRLDIVPERLTEDVVLGLEVNCRFKLAQAMFAAKEYASAIPLLQVLIEERTSLPKYEMKLDLATCYLHTDQIEEAELLVTDVHGLATVRGDSRLLAMTMYHLGLLNYHRKKYHVATYNGLRAIEQLDKYPSEEQDRFLRASVLTLLGRVHMKIGSPDHALRYYTEAAALHPETSNLRELAVLYMKMGQDQQRLNVFDKSLDYSGRAHALFRTLDEVAQQSQLDICMTMNSDTKEEAIYRVRTVIQNLLNLGQQEEASIAYIELADLYLQMGDVEEATRACGEAWVRLPESHVPQAKLHMIRGHIAGKCGQRGDAIQCFQQAADLFRSLGEWGRWDDALHEVANVYVTEQDYQRAYEVAVYTHDHRQTLLFEQGIVL